MNKIPTLQLVSRAIKYPTHVLVTMDSKFVGDKIERCIEIDESKPAYCFRCNC